MKEKKSKKNTKKSNSKDIDTKINYQDNDVKENVKIPSFLEVVESLHNFSKLSKEFGLYTYKKASELEMNQFENLATKSWIVNTFPIVSHPWSDPCDETPDYSTFEGLDEYFYLIPTEKRNEWSFSYPSDINCNFQSDLLNYDFNALYYFFNDTYKNEFEALDPYGETFYYYARTKLYIEYITTIFKKEKSNYDKMIEKCNYILQFCVFFLHNDKLSFFLQKNIHEKSLFTRNIVQGLNSFSYIMDQFHPLDKNICNICNVNNIDEYVKKVFIPFFSAYHNMSYCKYIDHFVDFDNEIMGYYILRNPHPKWIHIGEYSPEKIREFELEREMSVQKYREEKAKLEISKSLESETIIDETPVHLVINSRYLEIKKEEDEKKLLIVEEPQPIVEIIYKKESEIPKIMRRLNKNPLKEGSSLLLFHYGNTEETVYNRPILKMLKFTYSIQRMVKELPALLRDEHNKHNFMKSKNRFFERPVNEMNSYFKNSLYNTLISFCEEMASTKLSDNPLRESIIQNYYGKRLENEPWSQYYHNYSVDIGNSIALYYVYYSNKNKFIQNK